MDQKNCIMTCHGFTGYPDEMKTIGKYFEEKNFGWKNLQLPGHGTNPEDLKSKKWTDWTNYVLQEVDESLQEYNNNVIMLGLSLGGVLTLYTLIHRPEIKAGICLATPTHLITWYQKLLLKAPFIKFFLQREGKKIDIFDPEMKKKHKSYNTFYPSSVLELGKILSNVTANLSKITQPLLIIQSTNDQIVDYHNAEYINDHVASKKKNLIFVDKSSHVLTEDFDREFVFEKCYEFVQSLD